jgi:hypothetical protein
MCGQILKIFLTGLLSLSIGCSNNTCLPFEQNVVGRYSSRGYEGYEEILILKEDYNFQYYYTVHKKPIIKIKGKYSLNRHDDPNGIVETNINMDGLTKDNFFNLNDFETYKVSKKKVAELYYFENGEFKVFLNPEKLVWSCNKLVRNYDNEGDFIKSMK